MAKKPVDYTTQIKSAEERKRLRIAREKEEKQREGALLIQQAQSYGEVVREIFGRRMTIDALAGLLLDSRERLQTNPQLEGEWTVRGTEYFRPATTQRKQPAGPKGATGNGQDGDDNSPNGHAQNGESRTGQSRTGQSRTGQSRTGESRNGRSPTGAPALQPARPRPAAPPATPDLLGGLAPDQPSQGTPEEGGDHDGHP